jgi:predicted Zn finger-like uncharacterized protein
MSIQATCPNCKSSYNLRDEMRGKTVRCKQCQQPFVAGGAVKARVVEDEPEEAPTRRPGAIQARPGSTPPPVKGRVVDDKPRPRRRDDDDDYDDEDDDIVRPRKKSPVLMYTLLGVGGGALLLVLGCCGVGALLMNSGDDGVDAGNPTQPPADVAEAVKSVKDNGNVFRRNAALDWLAQAQPDDAHRAVVIQALEPVVSGGDLGASDQAAKALGHWAGPEQVPTLLNMVNHRSGGVRGAAIEALSRLRDERAIVPVAGRLPDSSDRAAAGRALEAIGPPAEKEVVKYAFHKDGGCREEARRLLKGYGTKDSELVSQAIIALKSPENESRHAAVEWLATATVDTQRGNEVAQALEPVLDDSNVFTRDPAATALCRWGTRENVPAVVKCLDSRSGDVRKLATDTLTKFKDERAAPGLARHLADPFDGGMYGKALEALGPEKAEKEVVKYFFDPNNAAQQEARRLTRVFNTKQEVIVAQAVADLKDAGANDNRQTAVCTWLSQTQPDAKSRPEAARALDPLVKSSNNWLREAAAKALVNWGTKDNVDTLIAIVQNGDFGLGGTRKLAIQALGNIKDDRAAPAVAARLPDFFDRETAAAALETMGPGAEKPVLPFVGHNDAAVRVLACRVLKTVGTKESLKALELHAKGDMNPEARTAAAMAYTAIKGRQ